MRVCADIFGWHGRAWLGAESHGVAGHGKAGGVGRGGDGTGRSKWGMAGDEMRGGDRPGMVRRSEAMQVRIAWLGLAWYGEARYGRRGKATRCSSGSGRERQGMVMQAWQGVARYSVVMRGVTWHGRRCRAWPCSAWLPLVRPSRPGDGERPVAARRDERIFNNKKEAVCQRQQTS